MSRLAFSALLASALTSLATLPAQAQDTRVTGTIQLSQPWERTQVMTARRPRLGAVVAIDATPVDSIGALLLGVTPNGPVAKAGMRAGDIIVRFNGKLVTEGEQVRDGESGPGIRVVKLANQMNVGDSVVVQYRRDKNTRSATVIASDEQSGAWTLTLDDTRGRMMRDRTAPAGRTPAPSINGFIYELRADSLIWRADSSISITSSPMVTRMRTPMSAPAPMAFMMGSPLANLQLAPMNPGLGKYFSATQGVLVINLPDSSELGLKPGDVILTVDGREVRAPDPLLRALLSYEPGEKVSFQVMRDNKKQTVKGRISAR